MKLGTGSQYFGYPDWRRAEIEDKFHFQTEEWSLASEYGSY